MLFRSLNLGAGVRIPGTIPALTAVPTDGLQSVTMAHAGGRVEVGSVFEGANIKSALLHRTARVLMKGDVFYTGNSDDIEAVYENEHDTQNPDVRKYREEI